MWERDSIFDSTFDILNSIGVFNFQELKNTFEILKEKKSFP